MGQTGDCISSSTNKLNAKPNPAAFRTGGMIYGIVPKIEIVEKGQVGVKVINHNQMEKGKV